MRVRSSRNVLALGPARPKKTHATAKNGRGRSRATVQRTAQTAAAIAAVSAMGFNTDSLISATGIDPAAVAAARDIRGGAGNVAVPGPVGPVAPPPPSHRPIPLSAMDLEPAGFSGRSNTASWHPPLPQKRPWMGGASGRGSREGAGADPAAPAPSARPPPHPGHPSTTRKRLEDVLEVIGDTPSKARKRHSMDNTAASVLNQLRLLACLASPGAVQPQLQLQHTGEAHLLAGLGLGGIEGPERAAGSSTSTEGGLAAVGVPFPQSQPPRMCALASQEGWVAADSTGAGTTQTAVQLSVGVAAEMGWLDPSQPAVGPATVTVDPFD